MMTRCFTAVCVFGLLTLAGCSQMPADTRDADARALRDNETAWNKDWAAKDLDRIAAHYADDANLMVAGMPIFAGKEAIRNGLKQLLADPNLALSFEPTQVEVAKGGDLAYTRGTYTMTMTDPASKKAGTEKGKYVTVYRKAADGSWKAVQDINNADPLATPAAK
jgi:uncharacterized protein (TIGR02246 family)